MKRADSYETRGVIVDCPYCKAENDLELSDLCCVEGDEVICQECKRIFELGKSL